LAVVFAAGFPQGPWVQSPVGPSKEASVFLVTDGMAVVPGAVVGFEEAESDGMTVSVTDADGQTPWFEVLEGKAVRLTVADTSVPGGLALGFVEELTLPELSDPRANAWAWTVARSIPVARQTLIVEEGTGLMTNILPADSGVPGDYPYPHWRLGLPAGSGLQFQAGLAPLLDAEAVAGYLAYRGHPAPEGKYRRGIAWTVPEVDLGELAEGGGLYFGIDLLREPGSFAVDAYNFHAGHGGAPGFRVETLYVQDGVLYGSLEGEIEAGHLALLVRPIGKVDGAGETLSGSAGARGAGSYLDGEEFLLKDEPPALAIPPRPAGETSVMACEPEVPDMGEWSCEPLPPSSDCPAKPLGLDCETTRTRSPRWCRAPGQTLTSQQGMTASFKVRLEATGGAEPLKSAGGFEYGHSSTSVQTDTWTAQAGIHGLGQCVRYFRFYLDCARDWQILVPGMSQGSGPGAAGLIVSTPCKVPKGATTLCHDVTDSSSVCDQTP
jgi:hypothetical protein